MLKVNEINSGLLYKKQSNQANRDFNLALKQQYENKT
jgi:hypothetical protein